MMTKKIPVYIREDIIKHRDTSTYKEVTSIINSKYNTNYNWYTIRDICCREGKLKQNRRIKARKEERICLYCKKHYTTFKRSNSNLKFCSRECYNSYKKENNTDRDKKIICIYCGKEFTMDLNHKNKRFCSQGCVRAYYRKRTIGRNMSYITQEDISKYMKDNSRLISELVRVYASKFNVSVEDLYEDIMCYITSIVYFYKKYNRFSLDKLIKRRALNLVKKVNKERLLVNEYGNNIL